MTAVIPSRESAPTKGRRYLLEGRLTIRSVHAGRVWAECRGDGETYTLGFAHSRWFCSCPARGVDCAHLRALRLVTRGAVPVNHTVAILRQACAELDAFCDGIGTLDAMAAQLRRGVALTLAQLAVLHALTAELVEAER